MCGIAGIFTNEENVPINEDIIKGMCDAIIHRGPDDFGMHVDNHVGMGMRRLSIIDVSGGRQPIANEDETVWIVFNGEIYNHLDLRNDLLKKGHSFKTKTDTETIVHLYEEHGVKCLEYLRGMFAFMIWDKANNRMFVARDRLGIKPCFWTRKDGKIAIASEIKSLLTLPWISEKIDWNGFDAFFTYSYIPAPLTIYRDIEKLPPAHYLLAENGNLTIKRYWDIDFQNKLRGSADDIAAQFLSIMQEAVEMRLMSEVPLGAFLSGGIDSGLIVALMAQNGRKNSTFTVNFSSNNANFLDERPFAREIAHRYSCLHNEIEVKPDIEQAITAATSAFDEPFADDGFIPTYHICEAAKNDLTVILTGLGGDENFTGYERHLGFWLSRFSAKLPSFFLTRVVNPGVRMLKEQKGGHYTINHLKRFAAAAALPAADRYQSFLRNMSPESRKQLYHPDISRKIDFEYTENLGKIHFERLQSEDDLDRALYQDLCMYMPDDILALSDRIGMHHSLELRVPFVDHKVVEFCARIPTSLKLRFGQKKYLLKKASRSKLPKSVIKHRKQGFCAPMASWLNNELRPVIKDQLSAERIKNHDLFNYSTISNLLEDHYSRRQLNDKSLFSLLVFQKWMMK